MLESFFKKVAYLEARKSNKRRLQHRCFHVNIAKFLKTAFSIEQLWWLLLELRIYENSMTQHNLMISFSVDSGPPDKYSYEIPHEYL